MNLCCQVNTQFWCVLCDWKECNDCCSGNILDDHREHSSSCPANNFSWVGDKGWKVHG